MRLPLAAVFALAVVAPAAADALAPQENRPTFRAGVDRVTITAVVHRRNGEMVTGLTRDDFTIIDNGVARPILEFRSEPTPATVALLVDFSGSMSVSAKMSAARDSAAEVLKGLRTGVDRVGLFAFDTRLHELQGFDTAPGRVLERFNSIRPFGSTSLYDAIAETGKRLAADGSTRRAIVALTDGGDNSSKLTAAAVSRTASAIDVPVYVVVIVSPLDRPSMTDDAVKAAAAALTESKLGDLARWTGGEIFLASSDLKTSAAAAQIVDELRHQYFIVFAPDTSSPGWHPIDVRTREKNLVVRSRSGYVSQSQTNSER
jgi:Ca-activated chloride channel family protein